MLADRRASSRSSRSWVNCRGLWSLTPLNPEWADHATELIRYAVDLGCGAAAAGMFRSANAWPCPRRCSGRKACW